MGSVYTFNFTDFATAFPTLAPIGSGLATSYFTRATFLFANDGTLDTTDQQQQMLLLLLTAHIAQLNAPRDANGNPAASGQPAPPLTGRINSASEGSVSVSTEFGDLNAGSPSQAWYMLTPYGQEYWTAIARFRMFQYRANPTRVPMAAFPGRLRRW